MKRPIAMGDPRPITRQLLTKLEIRAGDALDRIKADPALLSCSHHHVVRAVEYFCEGCGALVNLSGALWSMAPKFGMAYTLQEILRGNAIAEAQRKNALAHLRLRINAVDISRIESIVEMNRKRYNTSRCSYSDLGDWTLRLGSFAPARRYPQQSRTLKDRSTHFDAGRLAI
jgi:hypothetical protein